jgi:hypothetical protein
MQIRSYHARIATVITEIETITRGARRAGTALEGTNRRASDQLRAAVPILRRAETRARSALTPPKEPNGATFLMLGDLEEVRRTLLAAARAIDDARGGTQTTALRDRATNAAVTTGRIRSSAEAEWATVAAAVAVDRSADPTLQRVTAILDGIERDALQPPEQPAPPLATHTRTS